VGFKKHRFWVDFWKNPSPGFINGWVWLKAKALDLDGFWGGLGGISTEFLKIGVELKDSGFVVG